MLLYLICTHIALLVFVVHEKAWGWGIISFCVPGSGDGKENSQIPGGMDARVGRHNDQGRSQLFQWL